MNEPKFNPLFWFFVGVVWFCEKAIDRLAPTIEAAEKYLRKDT